MQQQLDEASDERRRLQSEISRIKLAKEASDTQVREVQSQKRRNDDQVEKDLIAAQEVAEQSKIRAAQLEKWLDEKDKQLDGLQSELNEM